MALDLYSSCPCGSGKKFKWCCQPIHVQVDRAFRQDEEGQHEVALRLMDELIAGHPANPEVWGRKAQLLYQNERVDDAEAALDKAFEISPNYPFGHLLRGLFRHHEGELLGALRLFRKAAELYDPGAHDLLAQSYGLIADIEIRLNRPIAARAAARISLHLNPNQPELRQSMDAVFGTGSRFPATARTEYTFHNPAASVTGDRRGAWDQALTSAGSPRLSDVARAFQQLTERDPEDSAAWFNLGLARAWLGDNAGAIEALDRHVAVEADEQQAANAWALAEVLRLGRGMEEQADYREYSYLYPVRDTRPILQMLQEWEQTRKLTGVRVDQEQGILSAMVLETGPVITTTPSPGQTARLGAYLLLMGEVMRLWFPNKEALDRVRQELQARLIGAVAEPEFRISPVAFGDVIIEALVFPIGPSTKEEAERRILEEAQRYFEEVWIHRPLRSLNRIPPVDAAGSGTLRRKLRGAIQFLQACAAATPFAGYDFDRLRQKLGLMAAAPAAPAVASAGPDFARMSAADLAGVSVEGLSAEQLGQAWQAAQQLDAHDLAGNFARALIARPASADQPDRFPWYSYLAQRALAEGNSDQALEYLGQGERADAEENEGRRRNEYDQRRAQVHAKRGEADLAYETFQRLIERAPTEMRYRGGAVEAMLSLKHGERAQRLAEEGLAKARLQNDRDSEQYFLELAEAAKKQRS